MKPVYLCINAIRPDHECTYAMCYACKTNHDDMIQARRGICSNKRISVRRQEPEEKNKRIREAMTSKYDDDICQDPEENKYTCRHSDKRTLMNFTMKSYFTKAFQEKIQSDETYFPIACSECGLTLKG